ncbi:MAG: hypothetical protein HRU22_14645 [Gammaproteobacteria bacterium]|nr:hypothetical protein [Gammaproteobacteria bacterium]
MIEEDQGGKQPPVQSISFAFDQQSTPVSAIAANWLSRSYFILILLGLMLGTLYWVLMILPDSIEPSNIEPATSIVATTPPRLLEQSPWHDAQLAKHRRAAQDVLSQVLEQQSLLEDKRIERWAPQPFAYALKLAEVGDGFYRAQQFSVAMEHYHRALTQLTTLENRVTEVFAGYLTAGQKALAAQNSQQAKQQLTMALYLKPNDSDASFAFDRAIVLDQVLSLIKAGNILRDEQQLEAAKDKFSEANSLDPDSGVVTQLLATIDEAIEQRDYSAAMSKGYTDINRNRLVQAIGSFRLAQKISPQATAPQQAITQSKNLQMKHNIAQLMDRASQFEQQEQWLGAQQQYQKILGLDSSLMAAKLGQISSGAREAQQQQLNRIIEQPLRLSNDKIYQQAQLTYENALKTKQPGKYLASQISQVKKILSQVRLPVALRIESDSHTEITLFRVGSLGNFSTRELQLRPGRYTIVGSRDGYLDVRQQITLNPNSQLMTIVVRCSQKVTNG